jgi:hypothetical protein
LRYRWTIAPTHTRHGRWCDTAIEARQDALANGVAFRELGEDRIYLDELVEIEEERE